MCFKFVTWIRPAARTSVPVGLKCERLLLMCDCYNWNIKISLSFSSASVSSGKINIFCNIVLLISFQKAVGPSCKNKHTKLCGFFYELYPNQTQIHFCLRQPDTGMWIWDPLIKKKKKKRQYCKIFLWALGERYPQTWHPSGERDGTIRLLCGWCGKRGEAY